MAYKFGQVTNMYDLLDEIVNLATANNWTLERSTNNASGDMETAMLKGVGDGNDNLYVMLEVNPEDETEFILDAAAGSDSSLESWEQPGSIRQWLKVEDNEYTVTSTTSSGREITTEIDAPSLSLTDDEQFAYFIFVNNYRICIICRMAIDYQSAYLGFLNPISSERQYPYPMYVAGNNTIPHDAWPGNLSPSFVFPVDGTGWLRRADGVWRKFDAPIDAPTPDTQGALFPYDCQQTSLVPNYLDDTDNVDDTNFLLIPIILHTNDPVDMNGTLRDTFWISGTRDVAAEQIVVIGSKQYMVFDSGMTRGYNTYFCVEMI